MIANTEKQLHGVLIRALQRPLIHNENRRVIYNKITTIKSNPKLKARALLIRLNKDLIAYPTICNVEIAR